MSTTNPTIVAAQGRFRNNGTVLHIQYRLAGESEYRRADITEKWKLDRMKEEWPSLEKTTSMYGSGRIYRKFKAADNHVIADGLNLLEVKPVPKPTPTPACSPADASTVAEHLDDMEASIAAMRALIGDCDPCDCDDDDDDEVDPTPAPAWQE